MPTSISLPISLFCVSREKENNCSHAGSPFLRQGIRAALRMRQCSAVVQQRFILSTLQRHDTHGAKFYLLVDILHTNCRVSAHPVSKSF